jgi:hypothetical protein
VRARRRLTSSGSCCAGEHTRPEAHDTRAVVQRKAAPVEQAIVTDQLVRRPHTADGRSTTALVVNEHQQLRG